MIIARELATLSNEEERAWTDLHRSIGSDNPFLHPAWVRAFAESHPAHGPARVLFCHRSEELIGVLPLGTSSSGRLGTFGSPLVDNGTPLVLQGQEPAFVEDLLDVAGSGPRIMLEEVEIALGDLIHRTAQHRGLSSTAELGDGHFAAKGWKEESESFRTTFAKTPAYVRRIRDDLGATFEFAASPPSGPLLEAETLRLTSCWARGRLSVIPPAARSTQHSALWLNLLRRPGLPGCRAEVATLRVDGNLMAAALSLVTNDKYQLVAQKATDTRWGNQYSPGMALDWMVMAEALGRGRALDFGRGDEAYKQRLGLRQQPMVQLCFGPGRPARRD